MKPTTFMLLMLVALFVAACSSDQSGSSSSQSGSSSSQSASAEASEAPESEATPELDSAEATLQPGAGDLAAVLPTEVGGIRIGYLSGSGAEVIGWNIVPGAQEFFDRVGADVSDLSAALGFGLDVDAGIAITIIALRVAGADEGRLREEFRTTLEEDETQTLTEAHVAGKDVLDLGNEGEDANGYVYVKGDIVFIVGGKPMSLIEEALSELP